MLDDAWAGVDPNVRRRNEWGETPATLFFPEGRGSDAPADGGSR